MNRSSALSIRLLHRVLQRAQRRRRSERGVSMVEFGLVFPLFIVLVIGLIEFAVTFNALLGVNFASRDAALIAAESGNDEIADCRILQTIEERITAPARADRIEQVRIYRAGVNGNEIAANVYTRGGSRTCQFWDGVQMQVIIVQYSLGTATYPANERCNILDGCGAGRTLDTIGVSIDYAHEWVTPLAGLVTLSGDGIDITRSNAMRMEPVL